MSPGGLRPRDPKYLKKVSGTVREVSGEFSESVWRVFLECSGTFWGPRPEARGRHFRDSFGISGPRDLCKGQAGAQHKKAVAVSEEKSQPLKTLTMCTLRAKGTLISEPRFSTPCEMRFFPREKGITAFLKKTARQRLFSLSRVGEIASRRG